MIKEKQALNICEADKILASVKETDKIKDTRGFIKKFCKQDPDKASKLKEEIEKLGLLKLKPAEIAKIVDLMPEDAAELNKIFVEVTLDADETNKILDTVKSNK